MKSSGAVFAIAVFAFIATLAGIIGSRLSTQTMTLLTGAACGAGIAAPFAVAAGMFVGAQRAARDRESARVQPPIVVMAPSQPQPPAAPMLPTWSGMPVAGPGMAAPVQRQYTILGEETVIDGTSDVWR